MSYLKRCIYLHPSIIKTKERKVVTSAESCAAVERVCLKTVHCIYKPVPDSRFESAGNDPIGKKTCAVWWNSCGPVRSWMKKKGERKSEEESVTEACRCRARHLALGPKS